LKVDVDFEPETKKMCVSGEFENIVGVFGALFENSVKYSRREHILIMVKCSYNQLNNKVICDVEDNGTGIPPEIHQHLFEPFFTTNKRGTGLGLTIVMRVMEACGGTIQEIGVVGKGAKFRLEFPLFESK
jgi:signal transduction histidine kinase